MQSECGQSVFQLLATAPDVSRSLRQLEHERVVDHRTGLRGGAIVDEHLARHDERLRLLLALRYPTIDEKRIESLLRHGVQNITLNLA